MSFEYTTTTNFAKYILNDTREGLVFWSRVGAYGGEYHSIDFREINKPLEKWTSQTPFALNGWNDMFVTNVMSGFVFLAKTENTPPQYRLYIQPDCDNNICLINCPNSVLKELYNSIVQNLSISYDKISDFMECYFARHSNHTNEIYEEPYEQ